MTLERHRSSLIPSVEFSGDGTILFTSANGSFPLRRQPSNLSDEPGTSQTGLYPTSSEVKSGSNRSSDGNNNKRMYKQRGSLTPADPSQIAADNTSSTVSSSLLRRLRRSKYAQTAATTEKWYTLNSDQGFNIDSIGKLRSKATKKSERSTQNSSGSSSYSKRRNSPQNVNSLKGRFSKGKPQMTPEIAASLGLNKSVTNSPPSSLSSQSGGRVERSQNLATLYGRFTGTGRLNLIDQAPRKRRFTEEPLPYIVFLIIGPLLIIVGIIRFIISIWHEYGNGIWAGVPIVSLGIAGQLHQRKYTNQLNTGLYISFGVVSSIGVMVASGLTLAVLVPMIYQVIFLNDATLTNRVLASVPFSNNFNHTLPGVNVPNQVTLTIILDFITLALLAVGFFSQTATVIAIDNYWGTNFDMTGDCDHLGNPRFFNPLEQMSAGQIVVFVGLVEKALIDSISPEMESTTVGLPMSSPGWTILIWDGVIVILAGFVSMCYGKRVDVSILGAVAMIVELVALTSCTVACIFTTMAISSVAVANSEGAANTVQLVSLIVIESIYDVVLVINIVFIIGIVFRQCQLLCSCCSALSTSAAARRSTGRFGRPVTDYSL